MDEYNLEQAKLNMESLEKLREEEKKLKETITYLPKEYDEKVIKEEIINIDIELEKLNEVKEKIELLNESGDIFNGKNKYEKLDEIISLIEQLIKRKESFEKYKNLNDKMNDIYIEAVLSVKTAREDAFSTIFKDNIVNKTDISSFVNFECLRNTNIGKPFMVALLTMDPNMVYETIINDSYRLTEERKNQIKHYIFSQKRRIDKNLVLSDSALINLLESNTGKNILEQERINSREKYYNYCNLFSREIFGKRIEDVLLFNDVQYVFNAFNNISPNFKALSNIDKHRIKQQLEYLKNLKSEEKNYPVGILNGDSNRYDIINKSNNYFYSLNGKSIKRFSDNNQFLRTIDDMRIADFPISEVEYYVYECFSSNKISKEQKQNLIAVALDNLELCIDLFNSYYKDGNMNLKSYLNMSTGDIIELNYELEEGQMPHILGIPSTYKKINGKIVGLNLPKETLIKLDLGTKDANALEVLERILSKKDDIINSLGCFKGNDGIEYEMLPWEKIILKTNAFIRGDFFKTTSFISGLNPDSYLISRNRERDKVNALALSSANFASSAINQRIPNIYDKSPLINGGQFVGNRNSLLQKNKDLILKGLMAQFEGDKITRIKGVQTNESFIGERQIKENGLPIKTLNKPSYLLENVNPNSNGVVMSIENSLGYKEYSIDELILLLEDMALSFENNQSAMDLVYTTIEQIENLNNSKKK